MLWLTKTGGPVYDLTLWRRAWLIPGRDLQRWLHLVSLHQLFSCSWSSFLCVITQEHLWMCLMSTFLHLTRRQIPSVLQVCAGPAHLQAQSLLNSSVQDRNQRSCSAAAVSVSACCLHHHTTSHYITLHHITSHYSTLHHTAGKNSTDQHQNTTYADLAGGHQQDQHMLCFGAGLCWFWSVQVLICAGFDLCWFWSVQVLICAGFGLCWFWSVLVLICAGSAGPAAALTGSMLTQTSARFWFFVHDFSLMSAFTRQSCLMMHQFHVCDFWDLNKETVSQSCLHDMNIKRSVQSNKRSEIMGVIFELVLI